MTTVTGPLARRQTTIRTPQFGDANVAHYMRNFRAFYSALFAALMLLPLQAFACSCWHPEP